MWRQGVLCAAGLFFVLRRSRVCQATMRLTGKRSLMDWTALDMCKGAAGVERWARSEA